MRSESRSTKGRDAARRAAALLAELRSLIAASEAEEDRYREALEHARDVLEAALAAEERVSGAAPEPAAKARVAVRGLQSIELEARGDDVEGDALDYVDIPLERPRADRAAEGKEPASEGGEATPGSEDAANGALEPGSAPDEHTFGAEE